MKKAQKKKDPKTIEKLQKPMVLAHYEALVQKLDFTDPVKRAAMIKKIHKNLPKALTLENFIESYLKRDRAVAEAELFARLEVWANINQQIEFAQELLDSGASLEITEKESEIDA